MVDINEIEQVIVDELKRQESEEPYIDELDDKRRKEKGSVFIKGTVDVRAIAQAISRALVAE